VIHAGGGVVTLTAQAADAVVDRVINMDGVIEARAVEAHGGTIILSGGEHGVVDVSGTLDASGQDDRQVGGDIKVLGETVGLFDGAQIVADGPAGGGEVLVGGNFQGKGPEPNAMRTYVDNNAAIHADALVEGDGGRVVVWSDERPPWDGPAWRRTWPGAPSRSGHHDARWPTRATAARHQGEPSMS
jgi:hypothetical protein